MELLNEYSLLVVVALPVAITAGINVALALSGESGTLLLPSLRPYPKIEIPRIEAAPEAASPEPAAAREVEPEYRRAA